MGQDRFVESNFLPFEVVSRLDRACAEALAKAQRNPEQSGMLTARFSFYTNAAKEVVCTWTLAEKFEDCKVSDLGRYRNGQLVLPGTDVLSDTPPEPERDYRDDFLAAPAAGRG